jgi:hypothetical protein
MLGSSPSLSARVWKKITRQVVWQMNGENDSVMRTEPVGNGEYLVRDGECLSSIADDHGHFWETIWDDPANAEVKRARKDPNVLYPGDRLQIMPLRQQEQSKPSGQRYRFRRKGVPAKLNLRFLDNGEPRAGQPYSLDVDGALTTGQTDDDGNISIFIPCGARSAILSIGAEGNRMEYELDLGQINPIESLQGVQQRLESLGYPCGGATGELNGETVLAIMDFQSDNDIEITGELSDETRNQIQTRFGC